MTYFADRAQSLLTPIIENKPIAQDTWRVRIRAPGMAQRVVPGQFFMVRNPAGNDPLIGRAFALYDVVPATGEVDLVYIVKGKLTTSLARLRAGDMLAVWGPLGNGFPTTPVQHLVMVAGGIGQTPFLTLAKEALGLQCFGSDESRDGGYAAQVSLCYGARSAALLAGVNDFEAVGVKVRLATEDGSIGPPQRVGDVLRQLLEEESSSESMRIVCCGPEPMMEAIAKIAHEQCIVCHVSLETPMACGIGICFTCVAKIGSLHDWDYKRTCVEGPVFDAADVQWR